MLTDHLNPAQQQAVTAPLGNVLVLAGAGSGKTRVLVHRIAWLIQQQQVPAWAILAVTFTNKAAKELRERLEKLLHQPPKDIWVGTFHGLAHRFLRTNWQAAGLPKAFQILDADDQLRLIKRAQYTLNLDETSWPPRKSQWFINTQKNEGRRSQHLNDDEPTLVAIYRAYQVLCERTGLVDFAELLLRMHESLRDQPALLAQYQERFQHVLVDEFQDINTIQYAWLQLLAKKNLFVVGDDDQAIYGWRGAKVENVQALQRDHPDTLLVRLEQNYRSTGSILQAANNLITYNDARLEKTLWTKSAEGTPIELYSAFNEIEEARFIAERIRRFVTDGHRHSEVAILYRTSAQSRVFEEALSLIQLPYRVYGGLRFFERAEIRDALAHLRLVANADDDAAFERVAGTPPKGIGTRTIEMLRGQAQQHGESLWRVMTQNARPALQAFTRQLKTMQQEIQDLALADIVAKIIELSALPTHYKNLKDGSGPDRLDNLDELINVSRRFADTEASDLDSFLAYAALEAGETTCSDGDSVQLMTLHAAKGLEFPLVFIVGLEEGLFPHRMSMYEPKLLEEERRLCYVGMTRAMHQLYLTHAQTRRLYGTTAPTVPSQFLTQFKSAKSSAPQPEHTGELRVGHKVLHPAFGAGVVRTLEGQGDRTRVQVAFTTKGTKWLVLAYANLQLVV